MHADCRIENFCCNVYEPAMMAGRIASARAMRLRLVPSNLVFVSVTVPVKMVVERLQLMMLIERQAKAADNFNSGQTFCRIEKGRHIITKVYGFDGKSKAQAFMDGMALLQSLVRAGIVIRATTEYEKPLSARKTPLVLRALEFCRNCLIRCWNLTRIRSGGALAERGAECTFDGAEGRPRGVAAGPA